MSAGNGTPDGGWRPPSLRAGGDATDDCRGACCLGLGMHRLDRPSSGAWPEIAPDTDGSALITTGRFDRRGQEI